MMLNFIRGELIQKHPSSVLVAVGGYGLQLRVPLSTYEKLPERGEVTLRVSLLVSTDKQRTGGLVAYGFASEEEHQVFELLLGVSGIGPTTALTLLSGMTVADFTGAVLRRDTGMIEQVRGIGRRTAERVVLELKERLPKAGLAAAPAPAEPTVQADTVQALVNFGFKRAVAEKATRRALKELGPAAPVEEVIRRALQLAG